MLELGSVGIPQEHGCVPERANTKQSARVGRGFHSTGNFQDLSGWGDPNNAETTKRWWSTPLLFGLLDLVC